MYNILQIGLGPLGRIIYNYIQEKSSLKTIAAVDINDNIQGKDLGELCADQQDGVLIQNSISRVSNIEKVDVILLTTSSGLGAIANQLKEILPYGIPVISTCEELSYSWVTDKDLSAEIDALAKEHNTSVLGTGVNPGFLMDTLPTLLTGVCKSVDHVTVNRVQDASSRRLPFQKKIGAGLNLDQFEERKQSGSLRHVGLTESMHFIGDALGWHFDHTEDVISPVIAEDIIETEAMLINSGDAMGVQQVGKAMIGGEEKVRLNFIAAVGLGESYDEVIVKGVPEIKSRIMNGVHGDIATCSIVLNAIPTIIKATPGLRTMKDIGLVSCIK